MTDEKTGLITLEIDGATWDLDVALWVDDVCQAARHATAADLIAALAANPQLRAEALDELFGLGRKDRETFWGELPAPVTGHIAGLKAELTELRRKLKEAEAELVRSEEEIALYLNKERPALRVKLEATESELAAERARVAHLEEAAELLRGLQDVVLLGFEAKDRGALRLWYDRDQKPAATTEEPYHFRDCHYSPPQPPAKPAATTEEQAAPAAGEPDYCPKCDTLKRSRSTTCDECGGRLIKQPHVDDLCDCGHRYGRHSSGTTGPCRDSLCPCLHWSEPSPAKPELPGGKGPDYVTRAELVAALRKFALYADADTAPRHIAWQKLANELEAAKEAK